MNLFLGMTRASERLDLSTIFGDVIRKPQGYRAPTCGQSACFFAAKESSQACSDGGKCSKLMSGSHSGKVAAVMGHTHFGGVFVR
jgi:hypothetical protein